MDIKSKPQKERNLSQSATIRVLALSNFDLNPILREWQEDGHSGHHLWGLTGLEKHGIESSILVYEKFSVLKNIGKYLKLLGDLDQELRVVLQAKEYDVIYSCHYPTTSLISFLRKIRLTQTKIIAFAHQIPRESFFSKIYVNLFVSGNDKILCLSESTKSELKDVFKIPEEKLYILDWGLDTSFHKPQPFDVDEIRANGYIFSSGKTYRDYDTLIKACSEIDYNLEILGYKDILCDLGEIPGNVKVYTPGKSAKLSEIIPLYRKAFFVAIPLDLPPNKPRSTLGLTSLIESMCMGRATLVTENRDLGIDIDKEKIGFVLPYKDVDAWRQAIQYLLDHPEEAQEMGRRARKLAESRFNLGNFERGIYKCIQESFLG
jgi:glycosyltransferase involved in cell wall biosynthesis